MDEGDITIEEGERSESRLQREDLPHEHLESSSPDKIVGMSSELIGGNITEEHLAEPATDTCCNVTVTVVESTISPIASSISSSEIEIGTEQNSLLETGHSKEFANEVQEEEEMVLNETDIPSDNKATVEFNCKNSNSDSPIILHTHMDVEISCEKDKTATDDQQPQQGVNDDKSVTNHEEEEENPPKDYVDYYAWKYQIPESFTPKCLIQTTQSEFENIDKEGKSARYAKGCKWAPDGSCLISCADDDYLRLFNFPSSFSSVTDWSSELEEPIGSEDWNSVLKVKEGGLIYDYCWYPLMSSMDPVSSCFISSSSEAPIHLWDAFTGKLRATYQPYNHLDQVISAFSLAFDPSGQKIYSGFQKSIRIFDITRPGRSCTTRFLKQKPPYNELNQNGIVASLAVNPQMSSFYAVGTFDKSIGLYYEDGSVICLLQGHAGGITHMKFSTDGLKLFTGGRRDSRLICWDMRKMGEAYKIYDRVVDSHQRIYFDVTLDNRYLISGGTDGLVKIWDLHNEETQPLCKFKANSDCVNGISLSPYLPLLATSSGQRHYYEIAEDSDEDELFVESKSSKDRSCDIKLWKVS